MRFTGLLGLLVAVTMLNFAKADIVTLEELILPPASYWNGSDGSGGFASGSVHFRNNYNTDWDFWDGFSYSNLTDGTTSGMAGQYSAIAGSGQAGSAKYAIAYVYVGWTEPPTITLDTPAIVRGLYVTNNNTAYFSMLNGDAYAKKFGGDNGSDPDWFLLTITGKDDKGSATGTAAFYLADFRFDDNSADYIVKTWQFVDLTSLGTVQSLAFSLSSSDAGAFGMNTPAYFAIDTIVLGGPFVDGRCYTESGVNGYVGLDGRHAAPTGEDAVINPIFRAWAASVAGYIPAAGVDPLWSDPNKALGRVTGNNLDIVSLGDLKRSQIDSNQPPGQITLAFGETVRNGNGYDFAIFENGLISQMNTSGGSVAGQMFAELGCVEVSSNGQDFARFAAVSLTPGLVGPYGTIQISNIYNLAGKHPNAGSICTGTPFDLEEIADDAKVISGAVDINDIKYVRIVDIPGSGDFRDEAGRYIDPSTLPFGAHYVSSHPIYDAWVTFGSGGFDLEAIGVLNEQKYSADINLDGVVDVSDFALLASAWRGHFGQANWIARCDLAQPKNYVVDTDDFAVFADQWLKAEQWRAQK
jgi:hypothetical protein